MKHGKFILICMYRVLTVSPKFFSFPLYLNLYYKVKLSASLLWRLLLSLFNEELRPTGRMKNIADNEDLKGVFE